MSKGTRKWLAIVGMTVLGFAVLLSKLPVSTVEAQAPERISQQTYPYSFTFLPSAGTLIFPIPNLGQSAHTVAFPGSSAIPYCVLFLQGSNDNSRWVTLDSLSYDTINSIIFTSASGQFQYFRLIYNPSADTNCSSPTAVTANYVGYQFPQPILPAAVNFQIITVANPQRMLQIDASPLIVNGLSCYNPNAAIIYVNVYDSAGTATAPTLPCTAPCPILTYALPASASAPIPVNNLRLNNGLWLSAVTAFGGSTPASSALTCNAQVNLHGPYF